jgi:hypothetical protein
MVETVAVAAAAEPAVAGGVQVQGPVGVGQPCHGEGTVKAVLPVTEDGMVRDVAGLGDVQVTGDDDRTAELGQEAGQRRRDGPLERSFILVPPRRFPDGVVSAPDQSLARWQYSVN